MPRSIDGPVSANFRPVPFSGGRSVAMVAFPFSDLAELARLQGRGIRFFEELDAVISSGVHR